MLTTRIGWWNTSLSPPVSDPDRPSAGKLTLAREVVRDLLIDLMSIEIIALGEVTESDVESLLEATGHPSRYGRAFCANRNLAVLYDSRRVFAKARDEVIVDPLDGGVVAALWIDFEISSKQLTVAAIHWPSRKRKDNEGTRLRCAAAVRARFDQARASNINAPVMMIGDFNDEPFDVSLVTHLLGTRDRNAVRKHDKYLYNPFWRLLGENRAVGADDAGSFAGSHFWEYERNTSWYTLDQALVSAALLRGTGWTLVEEETAIVAIHRLRTESLRFRNRFDHLPIALALEHRDPAAVGEDE